METFKNASVTPHTATTDVDNQGGDASVFESCTKRSERRSCIRL